MEVEKVKTYESESPSAPLGRREALLELFRREPRLALELLGRLTLHIPPHNVVCADPRAPDQSPFGDTVVLTLHGRRPVLGIIVDALVEANPLRRYAWPLQAAALRARLRCPVILCIVTPRRTVARWAATPMRLGAGNVYQPTVLGPASIPAITDPLQASHLPELAVLSTAVHGRGLDQERAARIAAATVRACEQLELERCQLYSAIVRSSLGEPARKLLHEMERSVELPLGEPPPHLT